MLKVVEICKIEDKTLIIEDKVFRIEDKTSIIVDKVLRIEDKHINHI